MKIIQELRSINIDIFVIIFLINISAFNLAFSEPQIEVVNGNFTDKVSVINSGSNLGEK